MQLSSRVLACPACTRPWVQSPTLQRQRERKRMGREEGKKEERKERRRKMLNIMKSPQDDLVSEVACHASLIT